MQDEEIAVISSGPQRTVQQDIEKIEDQTIDTFCSNEQEQLVKDHGEHVYYDARTRYHQFGRNSKTIPVSHVIEHLGG